MKRIQLWGGWCRESNPVVTGLGSPQWCAVMQLIPWRLAYLLEVQAGSTGNPTRTLYCALVAAMHTVPTVRHQP